MGLGIHTVKSGPGNKTGSKNRDPTNLLHFVIIGPRKKTFTRICRRIFGLISLFILWSFFPYLLLFVFIPFCLFFVSLFLFNLILLSFPVLNWIFSSFPTQFPFLFPKHYFFHFPLPSSLPFLLLLALLIFINFLLFS